MSETPVQNIARRLRVEGYGIDEGFMSNQGLCNRAAAQLEALESALIGMISVSQFPDRSHKWVKQAEEKAQRALAGEIGDE